MQNYQAEPSDRRLRSLIIQHIGHAEADYLIGPVPIKTAVRPFYLEHLDIDDGRPRPVDPGDAPARQRLEGNQGERISTSAARHGWIGHLCRFRPPPAAFGFRQTSDG